MKVLAVINFFLSGALFLTPSPDGPIPLGMDVPSGTPWVVAVAILIMSVNVGTMMWFMKMYRDKDRESDALLRDHQRQMSALTTEVGRLVDRLDKGRT